MSHTRAGSIRFSRVPRVELCFRSNARTWSDGAIYSRLSRCGATTLRLRRRESTRVNRFISRRPTRRQRETNGSMARCRGVVLSLAIRHVRRGHVLRLVHPKGGPRGLRVHARSISKFYYARRPRA